MFCSKCGNQIEEGTVFCPKCGQKIGDNVETTKEISPIEKRYEIVFSKYIINRYKSPSSCKWPKFETSMVKDGLIRVNGEDENGKPKMTAKIPQQQLRYIETYIDAQNSYGAMLREKILIVINEDGIPQRVLSQVKTTPIGGLTLLAKALSDSMNGVYYANMIKFPEWVDD